MANYSIAATEVALYGKTLAANTEDDVTIARDCDRARVYNDTGTAIIYFTVDGSTPTVAGNNTYRVPATAGASKSVDVPTAGNTVVKVISAGTPTYSVEGSI